MEIKIDMAPEDRPRRTSVKICNFIYLVSSLLRDTKLRFIEYFDAGIPLQGGKRVKMGNLIAEGGYSYVYHCVDRFASRSYALKRIRCQSQEQIDLVKAEIRYLEMLQHKYLLKLVDKAMIENGRVQEYYLLFPYYERGSIRNYIDENTQAKRIVPEKELLGIFYKICQALNELHVHNLAHRDIKPENVLLDIDYSPILIDLGSVAPAEVTVSNRMQALALQDVAARHSSMAYRAPELFDVPSLCSVNAKTDIWSMGCLLYAMAFGYSPFESQVTKNDEIQITECSYLRVIGRIQFPIKHPYSQFFIGLIQNMLSQDPEYRPDTQDLISNLDVELHGD